MSILGLDISTSCTGWSIINPQGIIVDIGYIDLSKEKSIFKKAKKVKDELFNIFETNKIEAVFIEENLQSFRSGFSSAATISTLAKFNGIVSFICFEKLLKHFQLYKRPIKDVRHPIQILVYSHIFPLKGPI